MKTCQIKFGYSAIGLTLLKNRGKFTEVKFHRYLYADSAAAFEPCIVYHDTDSAVAF